MFGIFLTILPCFLTILSLSATEDDVMCKYNVTVDITDGIQKKSGEIVKDNVHYSSRHYYRNATNVFGCICNVKTCIRKCCPIGMAHLNKTCRAYDGEIRIKTYYRAVYVDEKVIDSNNYYLLGTSFCPNQKYLLNPNDEFDQFLIQMDGKLFFPNIDNNNLVLPIDYCVDLFKSGEKTYVNAKLCGTLSTDRATKVFYSTGESFCLINSMYLFLFLLSLRYT